MAEKKVEEAVLTKDKPKKVSKPVHSATFLEDKKRKRKLKKSKKRNAKKPKLANGGVAVEVGGGQTQGDFTILEDVHQIRPEKIVRVLPEWLANPVIVDSDLKDDTFNVKSLEPVLGPKLTSSLEHNGVNFFFPVQREVIPWLLGQQKTAHFYRAPDLCVSAPTGSGKTLAYVLPILQGLKGRSYPRVGAIVVLPTEMLASQVFSVFVKFCPTVDLRPFLLSSKVTITSERKKLVDQDQVSTMYDIIVTTPGRLLDHLEYTEGFDISSLKYLIVDEADRTLDDQEGDWLERLELKFWAAQNTGIFQPWKSMPFNAKHLGVHKRAFQKQLWSATLSANPEVLDKINLFQPKLFASRSNSSQISLLEDQGKTPSSANESCGYVKPPDLKESFSLCSQELKPLVLSHLIEEGGWRRVLCFANTTESTHRLTLLLQNLLPGSQVREISSKWTPNTRELILKRFSKGQVQILVTSDLVARGIDIPMVDHVISYDMPSHTNTYIHRVGRTARGGQPGHALSLITKLQVGIFRKTMKSLGGALEGVERVIVQRAKLKALEDKFKEALSRLKITVEEEQVKTKQKRIKIRK